MKLKSNLYVIGTILFICKSNLVCNGDFQQYPMNDTYQGQQYSYVVSDSACWYAKSGEDIQVKLKTNPKATKCAQLKTRTAYTLCQKISLSIDKQYNFYYDALCPYGINNLNVKAWINGIQISSLILSSGGQFKSNRMNFTANISINQLCFSETHSFSIFNLSSYVVGGLVDNITLIQIGQSTVSNPINNISSDMNSTDINNNISSDINSPDINNNISVNVSSDINYDIPEDYPTEGNNLPYKQNVQFQDIEIMKQHLVIYFTTQVKQIWGQIHFISDINYVEWMQKYLTQNLLVLFEGEIQHELKILQSQGGKFEVVIEIKRNYQINNVEIYVPESNVKQGDFIFEIYVDGKKINFNILTQQEIAMIEATQPIVQIISSYVSQAYMILSSTFASYFILNLLNFWNLTLMYHFLLIDNVPSFVSSIYEYCLELLYTRGSLLEWMTKILEIPEQTFEFEFEKNMLDTMEEFKDGYSWFGNYQLSNLFFTSNFENITILGFCIVKIIALNAFIHLLSLKFSHIKQIKPNFLLIFLAECLALLPFFIISAISNIVTGYNNISEKLQTILQIIALFLSTLLIFIWLLVSDKEIPKSRRVVNKVHKLPNTLKSQQSQGKKSHHNKIIQINVSALMNRAQTYYSLNSFLLIFTIPLMILLKSKLGFFIVIYIQLIYSGYYLIRQRRKLGVKFFKIFMLFIYFVHHTTFFIMFMLEQVKQLINLQNEGKSKICVICGIIALFTIFIGGSVQIIQFIYETVMSFVSLFKKIKYFCCNQKDKINPANQQLQAQQIQVQGQEDKNQRKGQKNIVQIMDIEQVLESQQKPANEKKIGKLKKQKKQNKTIKAKKKSKKQQQKQQYIPKEGQIKIVVYMKSRYKKFKYKKNQ